MIKHIFLMLIVLLFNTVVKAQQLVPLDEDKYLDEITTNISSTDERIKLQNYLLLSEYWSQTDPVKSSRALNVVLQSTKKNVIPKGIIAYYQGIFYANQGNKVEGKKYLEKAIKLLEKDPKNTAYLIKAIYYDAYIQIEKKGYDFFVKALTEKCIPLAEKSRNIELLTYSYTQLGITFMSVGQLETAEEYHTKAIQLLDKIPTDKTIHLIVYHNLVSNYCYKPDSQTAKKYLDKAKNLIQDYPNSQHYPNYFYQEGLYYTTKQNYDEALTSLRKGALLAQGKKQDKLLHMLYFRMYNVYLMQKDYEKARLQLEKILKENVLSKESVNRKITYTQLASVNEVLGNYKQAYDWLKKSSALNDSLQQEKLLEKMNEFEMLHQTSVKEQTINQLEQDKKANQLLVKNRNLRVMFLGIALCLALIIACLIYLNYKKQQKLNKQINISHQQKLLHIDNERKYEATQAILQGEEQERQRIAQDLHDSMGGMLANIRMSISSSQGKKSIYLLEKIDQSIAEMRRISRNLMPETLKNLGLEIALKELCESMSYKNFFIQFESFNLSNDIPFQTQLALYRITQEAISNVIKYAHASNVIVQISQNDNLLNLTIEDDGIGFNKDEVVLGLGLKNIENRGRLINGTVDIITAKGEGTTINVECYV
jgi:signal transduction histidine kinase